MYTLKIRHIHSGLYGSNQADTKELLVLSDFLTKSVSWQDYVKKELAASPESYYNAGMCLAERHGDVVTISHLYADRMPEFAVPYDKLMKLIDDWLEACNKFPEEIVITMDDEFNFRVTISDCHN